MTFDELVSDVMVRLNLTSEDARTRIGQRINDRYRRVTSSIGLQTSRRLVQDVVINPDLSTNLPDYTIQGMAKVLRIARPANGSTSSVFPLEQRTFDDIANLPRINDTLPYRWAVKAMGSTSTTVRFDAYPRTESFTLTFEGYELADVLADDVEPAFSADFHDILVEGAMSDELRKMEKPQLAQIAEQKYEQRLSDLRMFIAKSGYLDIVQGRDLTYAPRWNRPWPNRWTY